MHWIVGASDSWADRCLGCKTEFEGTICPRCQLIRRTSEPSKPPSEPEWDVTEQEYMAMFKPPNQWREHSPIMSSDHSRCLCGQLMTSQIHRAET